MRWSDWPPGAWARTCRSRFLGPVVPHLRRPLAHENLVDMPAVRAGGGSVLPSLAGRRVKDKEKGRGALLALIRVARLGGPSMGGGGRSMGGRRWLPERTCDRLAELVPGSDEVEGPYGGSVEGDRPHVRHADERHGPGAALRPLAEDPTDGGFRLLALLLGAPGAKHLDRHADHDLPQASLAGASSLPDRRQTASVRWSVVPHPEPPAGDARGSGIPPRG